MNLKNKTLHLFTIHFPYGTGENFLDNELFYLATKFDSIFLYPLTKPEIKPRIELPTNVSVIHFDFFFPYNRINILKNNFKLIVSTYIKEVFLSKNGIKHLFY